MSQRSKSGSGTFMSSAAKQRETDWQKRLAEFLYRRSTLWIILGLITVGVLIGHQLLGVIDRDEARFAQASKQMLASGDYITPYFMDELRAKKPIAIYWLQSASAALFGSSDIASYRLPSLLGLLTSLVLVWRFSQSLWPSSIGPVQALVTVLLLAASPLIIAEAHLAKTDSALLSIIIAQQFFLWRVYKDRSQPLQASPWLGFWLCLSFGVLLKGPIAPLLAFTTCLVLVLVDRTAGWLKRLHIIKGLMIVACVVLPWAVAVTTATDGAFLNLAVKGDFLAKVQSAQESHGAPPGTYLLLLGLLFWPGIAFSGYIVWLGRRLWGDDAARFCVAWFAGYWLVIEFVPTKLPHYSLPSLPALALLCGYALTRTMPPPSKLMMWFTEAMFAVAGLFGVVFAGALLWASVRFGGLTGGSAFLSAIVAALLIGFCLWRIWCWRRNRRITDLFAVLGAGVLVHIIAVAGVVAGASSVHISGRLATEIQKMTTRPAAISLVGYHEPSAVFHLGRDVFLLDASEAALFMADSSDGVAVVERRALQPFLETAGKLDLTLVQTGQVSGFTLARGRDVELILYRRVDP